MLSLLSNILPGKGRRKSMSYDDFQRWQEIEYGVRTHREDPLLDPAYRHRRGL